MAVYKVPQDVEAEDKLIGPFSFRQFIYILIAVGGIVIAYFLGRMLLPLAIIPLPVIIFFGALALPLRKDQPMEIYLAALLSYYLKPRKKIWQSDENNKHIEIISPQTVEINRTKDLTEDEAVKRLTYLAQLADSRGWATKGIFDPKNIDNINNTSQQGSENSTEIDSTISRIDDKLNISDNLRRQSIKQNIQENILENQDNSIKFSPYPDSIRQSVIKPRSKNTNDSTSNKPISPDIINLVNSSDLSVKTIADQANRIDKRNQELKEEVVINLHDNN